VTPNFKGSGKSAVAAALASDWVTRAERESDKRDLAAPGPVRRKIYLHPGQLFAAGHPATVTTILGSCVSLCLWDPMSKIGGMNHFLLPFWIGDDAASPRFGTVAIESLIEKILQLGANKTRLRGKIFGGACVIEAFRERDDHIGIVNARLAENMLRLQRIPVLEHDVAGRRGRKLVFNTDDGVSSVKYL
jgi:chemotaxis protein CheD